MTATLEAPMKAKKKTHHTPIVADLLKPDTSKRPLPGVYNAGKPIKVKPVALPEDMADRLLNLSSAPDQLLSAAPVGLFEMSGYFAAMSDSQLRRGFKACVIEGTTHDMEAMGVLGTDKARGFLTGLFRCLEVFHQRFVRLDPPKGVRGVGSDYHQTRSKRKSKR